MRNSISVAQFVGLSAAASGFTMSPDGGVISQIFDSFVVRRAAALGAGETDVPEPPAVPAIGSPERPVTIYNRLVASPEARGARISLQLRGWQAFLSGPATLSLTIAGTTSVLQLAPVVDGLENFELQFDATLGTDSNSTDMTLSVSIPAPSGTDDSSLGIDTIDIALEAD